MAHPEQKQFFEQLTCLFPETFEKADRILEIGSQDINGSIRSFFPNTHNYIGLDLGMARGVDWTVPGELIELPDEWADISISTECFEHAECWPRILINMVRITREDGLLILTMAGDGRATHGTIDSDEGSSPFTTSYYSNIGVDELTEKIRFGLYFKQHGFVVNSQSHDTYFWGIRSGHPITEGDSYWDSPMDRLARAQGQLAQAVHRHHQLQEELRIALNKAEEASRENQSQAHAYMDLEASYKELENRLKENGKRGGRMRRIIRRWLS